jgi:hypothetical protein
MAFWHWLVLAALFAVIEVASPAMVCIWLAAAAVAVAIVDWAAPGLAWEYQALLFAAFALIGVAIGRLVFARAGRPQREAALNRRAETYVGRAFTLDQAIVNGRGRLRVDDTVWQVEGPDLPPGARVRVTGAESTVLRVEPA